jgi:F0F1-type ATP synthase assembly protein I
MYGVVGVTAPKNRLGLAYATNLSFSLIAGSLVSYGVGYLASAYTLVVVLPILVLLAIAASLMILGL